MSEVKKRVRWDKRTIASLAYMIGRGKRPAHIAIMLGTTKSAIEWQASQMGLSFRSAWAIDVPELDKIAESRGVDKDALYAKLLKILNKEPGVVKNLLDENA
jgi:hypothetical protein